MQRVALVLCLVVHLGCNPFSTEAAESNLAKEITAAAIALDEAFEKGDAEQIKQGMTADHIAVTPYYDGPQSTADQLKSLPELKYKQIDLGEPQVIILSPEAALRIFTADFVGTFKNKPLPRTMFVTAVMVKHKGRWLEKFYQMTELSP